MEISGQLFELGMEAGEKCNICKKHDDCCCHSHVLGTNTKIKINITIMSHSSARNSRVLDR